MICCERMYTHVHVHARCPPAHASVHCTAQHVAAPTIMLNFHKENFCDQKSNYEFMKTLCHENFELYGIAAEIFIQESLGSISLLRYQVTEWSIEPSVNHEGLYAL